MVMIQEAKQKITHLKPNEWAALEGIVARLHERYGDDLLRVVLFGSKARGDFDEESDLDLLIVVRMDENDYRKHWHQILDDTWEIELEHGIVTTMLIKSFESYAKILHDGLLIALNIERDGVELWKSKPEERIFEFG